jgi:hypothetical protein
MSLPAEEPVIKAANIAVTAKRHGWHGNLDSNLIEGQRLTRIAATRNDESVVVRYTDNTMTYGQYSIFNKTFNLHCASVAIEKLCDWPDILKLFKWFPAMNKPTIVETYRRLPFSFDDDDVDIMAKLLGQKLFWYSHESRKLHTDVVLAPRTSNSKSYRIAQVGHRKIFHFIGAQAGFRSVLLDTVIKVG